MKPRLVSVVIAYACLDLAVILMILEAVWIDQFIGKLSYEFMVTGYCVLLGISKAGFFFLLRSPRGWIHTALILLFYTGLTVPEGIEDIQDICRSLFSNSEELGLALVRLAFTSFLAIPLIAFTSLLVRDIRLFYQRKHPKPQAKTKLVNKEEQATADRL